MHLIMAYLNFVFDVMISDQKQKGPKMGALLIETVWRNSLPDRVQLDQWPTSIWKRIDSALNYRKTTHNSTWSASADREGGQLLHVLKTILKLKMKKLIVMT